MTEWHFFCSLSPFEVVNIHYMPTTVYKYATDPLVLDKMPASQYQYLHKQLEFSWTSFCHLAGCLPDCLYFIISPMSLFVYDLSDNFIYAEMDKLQSHV